MSVRFRVSSRKCLRDVVVMSETGAFESSSADEIKFGVAFLSGELCIKVMIYDLDVVMRSSGALSCDKLTLCFQLGYDRAVGIVVIRTMEIVSGDVIMKLDNDFFPKAIHHQLLPCLPKNLIKSISCQHLQNILCIFLKRFPSAYPN